MNNIIKICKTHGQLTINEVSKQFSKHKDKKYPYYSCKKCISIKRKRLYKENPEKHKKYALLMRKKHYDKCIQRDRELKLKKLLSIPEYEKLLIKQKNLCGICKLPETHKNLKSKTGDLKNQTKTKRLAVDHCHKTKKVRGLLCAKCNTALGSFKDSVELLQLAIEYLKKST